MNTVLRALALASVALTLALTAQSVERNVPFVAAFTPLNSNQHPFSGDMTLNFNRGIITGSYTDMSSRPGGPLANRRNVAITGGVDAEGNIHLQIGPMAVRGTLSGQSISGTGTVSGRRFTFRARQGVPGQPAH